MWTINYKGAFIHGYCDRKQCKVQFSDTMIVRGPFPSMDAAKRYIRTAIKNGDFTPCSA